jgi:hypothetical protein
LREVGDYLAREPDDSRYRGCAVSHLAGKFAIVLFVQKTQRFFSRFLADFDQTADRELPPKKMFWRELRTRKLLMIRFFGILDNVVKLMT